MSREKVYNPDCPTCQKQKRAAKRMAKVHRFILCGHHRLGTHGRCSCGFYGNENFPVLRSHWLLHVLAAEKRGEKVAR